jgi:hypothetical protein
MSAIARPMAAGYFECDIPNENVRIQFNPEAMERLGAAVMEGFKAVPRRGLEVGGLLVGRVENDCVIVEDIEAVDSEHQRGPSWLLSEKDKRRLSVAVARVNNDDTSGRRVVGFYRSQTRAGFAPTEEDVALMEEHGGGRVFLLVKPEAGWRSTALFAAGDGLRANSEVFPFRVGRPGGSVRAPVATPRAISTPMPPAAESAHFEHLPRLSTARAMGGLAADLDRTPASKDEPIGLLSRIAWPVAILLCAAAGGYGLARWWNALPRSVAAGAQSMALDAIWSGTSLHLQWNRFSPLIRGANRGVLWIDDGSRRRHLDLKAEDLTQGSIQYWPSNSDVDFKLEVFTPRGGASESIRALSIPLLPVTAARALVPEAARPSPKPFATVTAAHPPAPEQARPVPAPFATVDFEALGGRKQGAPPKPLHRVIPAGSADLGSRLKHDVAVDVRVDIDAAGKVKRAALVSQRSDARREFESLALGASRAWTFTPARNGDRRMPGQAVLHYHFGSSAPVSARLR